MVLGICGGLQMLGQVLEDPHGIDGAALGLGLLELKTRFEISKTVRSCEAQFTEVGEPWHALSHLSFKGFEIHHGQTTCVEWMGETESSTLERIAGLAWQNSSGNVLGLYVHGLFENPNVLRSVLDYDGTTLDQVFDGLADFLEQHMARSLLDELIE